jgi:hypothetical protein
MSDEQNQQKPQQQQRTRASIRKAIEGELTEAKLKEVKAKLKTLITELRAAESVVAAKEAEIEALYDQYTDIIPE